MSRKHDTQLQALLCEMDPQMLLGLHAGISLCIKRMIEDGPNKGSPGHALLLAERSSLLRLLDREITARKIGHGSAAAEMRAAEISAMERA
jgi:hypothetical protein